MKRFAVAYMSFMDNDIKIIVVEAKNEIDAIKNGVLAIIQDDPFDTTGWLDDIMHNAVSSLHDNSVEFIKKEFFNNGSLVTVESIDDTRPLGTSFS